MLNYFFSLLLITSFVYSAKLPSKWKVCKRNDPNMNGCMKEAIQFALKQLENGSSTFGIMPLKSIAITRIKIEQGHGPVAINLELRDITLSGILNIKLNDVRFENDSDLYMDLTVPTMNVTGKYTIDGKILSLPIKGDGDCFIAMDGIEANGYVHFKTNMKNGKEYYEADKLELTKTKWNERGRAQLDNLFNGDKALGNALNLAINENWDDVAEDLAPAFIKAMVTIFKDLTNKILVKIPKEEIFPK